ncbi:Multidrug resistance-associated protein 1 [Dissophora globulifera]|nr:Multidrug resistance-associated protein 1 [Dissophora globulifera]
MLDRPLSLESWQLFTTGYQPDRSAFSVKNVALPSFLDGLCTHDEGWALAVVLNKYEHDYEIRSSSAIFAYYAMSIASLLATIHTALDTGSRKPIVILLVALTSILTAGFIVEGWPRGSTRVQQLSGVGLYGKANLFSRLTFFFYSPIIKIGLYRTIKLEDLAGQLPQSMTTAAVYGKLSSAWNVQVRRYRAATATTPKSRWTPSLFATILKSGWSTLVPVLISRIAIVLFTYTLPVLLKQLLSYLEDYNNKPVSYGLTLAFGMFLSGLFSSLLNTYNRYQMLLIGVSTRSALISMIYRKSLRLSARSKNESTSGEIANLISQDADSWWDAVVSLSLWISIPVELMIAMWLLYNLLGWCMLAGIFTMLAMLPLQAWQARVYETMQAEKLRAMDQRVRLTTDVLASMKIIKLYGWSAAFLKRILNIRRQELAALRRIGVVQSFMSIVFISSSLIISLVTFSVYALWGGPNFTPGKLTPQTVFVSLTLFSMLKGPIASLSDATTSTISTLVSTRRIQKFLMLEEVSDKDVLRFDKLPRDPLDPVISIKDATFSWTGPVGGSLDKPPVDERSSLLAAGQDNDSSSSEMPPTLKHLNLAVGRGSLTALVGRVGQGKSSLLSAIINDMYKIHGHVQVSGRIAYVPQQAWIINRTLKDNILFGNAYNEIRYKHVLFACGLEPDIAMLPAGDMTEIGERGINLSGGQKQRVSLARAAYDDADIYLLDDPLSAVDAHVDKHLWQHLLGPTGLLRDKARLLVTHGIHHLREMQQIVLLKDGMILEKGDYSELMSAKKAFYRLIKEYAVLERRNSHPTLKTDKKHGNAARLATAPVVAGVETPEYLTESGETSVDEELTGQESSDNNTEGTIARQEFVDEKRDTKAELIAAEAMKQGEVGFDVVVTYAKAASLKNAITIVVLFIVAQGCLVATSLWLKYWIKQSKNTTDDRPPSLVLFLGVYALLTLVYVLIYVVVMWLALAIARIRAAERIHAKALDKIFRLPIAFFDTTPLGRIINRFSSDMSAVDIRIPNKTLDVLLFGISVSSTLLLIVFTTRSFIYVVPLLLLAYWGVVSCFLGVSRTLARLYSVIKSPVYQHFNESLGGVSTLRAMKIEDRFVQANAALADRMSNTFLCNMSSRRWLDVQLRILSTVVLLFTALFAVLGRERMDPSLVGLTLSFAMTITEEVTTLVRNFCDLQNQLVAMERVLEYTDLKTEAPETTDIALPPSWRSQGRIQFYNYSTRYREGLDLVIKHIDLDIAPAEKVGIVGRTGAGKSSLTLALFRIVEAANSYWAKESDNSQAFVTDVKGSKGADLDRVIEEIQEEEDEEEDGGRIEIDGIDISKVGLQDLRKRIAIIPQDPTLFSGSVRQNLDPFQELEDVELWEALDRSHLKAYISSLPGGLSFEISQNGENFSVGQRSLICLARALLRKTKILIMDEATAAVDVETDELIQKTIRKEFKDRTILTIAHRIKTVMDSDKILVLERGRVVEFDAPGKLLKNEASLFHRLAEQAGEI